MIVPLAEGSEVCVCRHLPANEEVFYSAFFAPAVNDRWKEKEKHDGGKT